MAFAPQPPLSPCSRLHIDSGDHPPSNPAMDFLSTSDDKESEIISCTELDFKVVAYECDDYNKSPPCCIKSPLSYLFTSMEVFSAVINEITSSHFYGKIHVDGPFGDCTLFERVRPSNGVNNESSEEYIIFANHNREKELLLSFQTQRSMIVGVDPVYFVVEIRDDNNKLYRRILSFDEIAIFDTHLSVTFSHCAVGSVTLDFAMFQYPVAAKVRVVLLQQDRHDDGGEKNLLKKKVPYADHVVGQIFAINSLYEEIRSMLFFNRKKKMKTPNVVYGRNGYVIADDEKYIPLSKSIVVMPSMAEELLIALDLFDSNTGNRIIYDAAVFRIPSELRVPATNKTMAMKFPVCKTIGNKIRVIVTFSKTFNGV